MKIALVYSFAESDWFSCTVILKNLLASYTELYGEENIMHIDYTRTRMVKTSDLEELKTKGIEKVYFIDHKPTPIDFLKKLKAVDGGELDQNREYIIHVFGDFPLYIQEWRAVSEVLLDKKVKFICASEKQKKYIQQFFIQDEIVFHCPFPVNPTEFFPDEKLRKKTRADLNLNDDQKVFLYTGRLSYQKRIVDLVQGFYAAIENQGIPKNSKLLIAGPFDELGVLYLGKSKISGEYFREIDRVINANKELCQNIELVGELQHEKLNALYNAADFYISFSTYHDEDYGMSVAEAICSGLPAILTNWAGYKSFQISSHPELCELIPVKLSKELPIIVKDNIVNNFKAIMQLKHKREDIAKWNCEVFSVKACAKTIDEISKAKVSEYTGRTELMIRITNENFLKQNDMFRNEVEESFNNLYYEAYSVYSE